MAKIYKYKPVLETGDFYSTLYTVKLTSENNEQIGNEKIAEIDEFHYFVIFDGFSLPEQSDKLVIEEVQLTPELIAQISKVSRHIQLIDEIVRDKISEKYSITDEIKLLRTAPSTEFEEYNLFVEQCRAWGRSEKAKFGL